LYYYIQSPIFVFYCIGSLFLCVLLRVITVCYFTHFNLITPQSFSFISQVHEQEREHSIIYSDMSNMHCSCEVIEPRVLLKLQAWLSQSDSRSCSNLKISTLNISINFFATALKLRLPVKHSMFNKQTTL